MFLSSSITKRIKYITFASLKGFKIYILMYFKKINIILGKVVVHSIPPYAICWTSQHICVAGPDKKVAFYTEDGLLAQQFDYFRSFFIIDDN